jgi:transposase-like protein
MILNLKEKKELNDDKLESVKAQVELYTKSRDELIAKRYGISPTFLETWIKRYSSDR